MEERIEDLNLADMTPLTSPNSMKRELPLDPAAAAVVRRARRGIRDIIHGRDTHRLVMVVGPCSIHDLAAAREYAHRLKPLAEDLSQHLLIVMRTYFEKPRTTVGWKGLINDPHLDGSCDIATGLELARRLLLEINQLGLPCGYEGLDPVTPQYIGDLISWAAIGARTTESQTHREMASGLSMPVGFKNATNGSLEVALHAMISARHPHSFLGINSDGLTSVIKTSGNPDRHVILRGGGGRTNYAAEDIAAATELVHEEGIIRPVMVDCSHGNSRKEYARQIPVAEEVLREFAAGRPAVMGLMLESNLRPGAQGWKPGASLEYGVSITDACIGWDETAELLREASSIVANARHGS